MDRGEGRDSRSNEITFFQVDQSLRFEEMIEQNKGLLYKVVNLYCQNEDDKGDLLQEIKIQLWRSFGRYNNEYKLSTWIYRISLNVAISFFRKKSSQKNRTVSIEDYEIVAERTADREQDTKVLLLKGFIGELNELDKALMLLYLDETSHTEIADVLGISATNVSTKIARIKVKLKERFIAEGY